MPMEMPVPIRFRVPPSSDERLFPALVAASAQAPISIAAWAISWPRRSSARAADASSGVSKRRPSTRGASHSRMASAAVSMLSGE